MRRENALTRASRFSNTHGGCIHALRLRWSCPIRSSVSESCALGPHCRFTARLFETFTSSSSASVIAESLRFAGGDGAQRRSGRRIFGTRPKGRTARTGRSVAHTLRCLYQRRRLKRRVSEGGSGEVQARPRERRSGTDRDDDQKDPSSGRRRGGVSQRDSESDARAR